MFFRYKFVWFKKPLEVWQFTSKNRYENIIKFTKKIILKIITNQTNDA